MDLRKDFSLMVPNWNSVVSCCKTTMWSCLSWTACSHVCSRTSSCFAAYYHSSFPKNLAMSSRRFVLQTFFSDMLSLKYPITNQIWTQADMMVGTSQIVAFCSQLAPPLCHPTTDYPSQYLPIRIICKVVLPRVPSISDDKKKQPLRCLQQGNPHHPY